MPNKLSQFWQELKRRNVTRVLAVYIAAAFMILELISMTSEPFGLPEGTLKVAFIISLAGLVIAFIVSWIFDIQPEAGIVKTEAAQKGSKATTPLSSKAWKIASYISFVVIVVLIVLNVMPRIGKDEMLEKSIAVLPFENMGSDESSAHIGGAFTYEIIMELQKIKAFDRVLSRTTTMQYDESRPTIKEIAEKLNVNYIVEGSIQRHGDQVRVRVQLLRAKNETLIWALEHDGVWEDIFTIQDEIADNVSRELQGIFSSKEKEDISINRTDNFIAYDIYLNARNEHINYWQSSNIEDLNNAIDLYQRSIDADSTYGQAYAGLALAVWNKLYWSTFFEEPLLDSILKLTRNALSLNKNLEEAYFVRGKVYDQKNDVSKALRNLDEAIEINPNYAWAYSAKGVLYRDNINDFVRALQNFHTAVRLDHTFSRTRTLRSLGYTYRLIGFAEEAEYFQREALRLDNDSTSYFDFLSTFEYFESDLYTRLEIARERYKRTPISIGLDGLIRENSRVGNHELAYRYALEQVELGHDDQQTLRIAYAFWKVGKKEEAMDYFERQTRLSLESIEMNNRYGTEKWAHYDLAAVYAFLGDEEKAYQYLAEVRTRSYYPLWWRDQAKYDLLFENIRESPQFQDLLQHMESTYQAEHERVRKWLEENDML